MNDNNESYQPIAKAAQKLWMIHGCISASIFLGIAIGVYFILYAHVWIFGLVALEAIAAIFIMPAVEYRQWRYFIGADRIEIIHGIFFTNRTLIPINRIQHLKIEQGILQKRFDLATVDLYTAGGIHQIKGLRYAVADEIARNLNRTVLEENERKVTPAAERDMSNEGEA
jgi:membrane protein YdbS with pleckstrin-like domain